jgi:hypothetical protein
VLIDPFYYTDFNAASGLINGINYLLSHNSLPKILTTPQIVQLLRSVFGTLILVDEIYFSNSGYHLCNLLTGNDIVDQIPALNQNVLIAASTYLICKQNISKLYIIGMDFHAFAIPPDKISAENYADIHKFPAGVKSTVPDNWTPTKLGWSQMQHNLTAVGLLL